jgi:hypothetical protein
MLEVALLCYGACQFAEEVAYCTCQLVQSYVSQRLLVFCMMGGTQRQSTLRHLRGCVWPSGRCMIANAGVVFVLADAACD